MSIEKINIIRFSFALLFVGFILVLFLNHSVESTIVPPGINIEKQYKPSQGIQIITSKLDSIVQHDFDSARLVGAAITVVQDSHIVYQKPFGVKECDGNDSVSTHTLFRLASVSKGFAGILSGLMAEKGVIDLKNKVHHTLPDFQLKDSLNTKDLTIEHLLNHTSGLVPHSYDNLIEDGLKMKQILPMLNQVDISAPPGKLYGYQNVVFSLIDTILELKTSQSYSSLLRKKIFEPLKMYDASASYDAFLIYPDKASPHGRNGRGFVKLKYNNRYYHSALPAAGVNASISDLSKWLIALLGNNPKIISQSTLDTVFSPRIKTPLRYHYFRQWDKIDNKYYGLGWRVIDYKGKRIIYHGGYVKGYKCEIAICPSDKVGIAYVTNSPGRESSTWIPSFFNLLTKQQKGSLSTS